MLNYRIGEGRKNTVKQRDKLIDQVVWCVGIITILIKSYSEKSNI